MTDIGTILGGRYRLIELLGQGGMATIYRARDAQLERDVAVKVLRPEYGADPDFIDRFRHEAQSAASLNHPSVVAVYDYGTDPVGPFIVMELVEGEDLATILRRSGALPPRAAARLISEAARAIAAAHDRGFVHRDIKPGNILVTREGRVKVADFGIARALSESALTLPGTTLGSVHYFSPEQARGELATPASDIYSLGIVLFELLTGRRPWTGDTAAAIATARLTGAVPSPSAVHGGIPPTLEAIDRKALATNPDDRFATAAEMAAGLEQFLGEERGAGLGKGSTASGAAAAAASGAGGGAAVGAAGAGGAGAAGAAAAGAGAEAAGPPTVAAGIARANPEATIDYPRDAYARTAAARSAGPDDDDADEPRGTSPWLWLAGLLAIVILGLAAFALTRLIGEPGASPAAQVLVPNLVGKTFEQAQQEVAGLRLDVQIVGFEESTSQLIGTITSQDPGEGATVDAGTVIKVKTAVSPQGVAVPDLRGRPEQDALNLMIAAGLTVGTRTEAFDPLFPVASIVDHDPGPNEIVLPGTAVSYVVSKGPEPTPTPSPTPEPTPTPTPTPVPTAAPTPTPVPDLTVGEYRCTLLLLATGEIQNDGFTVGSVSGPNADDSIVVAQDPAPGANRPPGSQINLTVVAAPAATCPA